MFLTNLKTVLKDPALGLEYAAYNLSRLAHSGKASRTLPGDIKVTGFSGFGEYHSCGRFIGPIEYEFLSIDS